VLELCRAAAAEEPDAALAIDRWEELRRADAAPSSRERRFRRRTFERARDRALQALAMRLKPWMLVKDAGRRGHTRLRQPVRRWRRAVRQGSKQSIA
jgi:hypothetical protein